ncbi:MAG: DEAD/DEAH box helicase [Desulfurococcaceae archaeon]
MEDINKIAVCLKELGYRNLTEIQRRSLREIYKSTGSFIIVAPTGSGKTEAAMFPVMLKVSLRKLKPIAVLYITPLRALNRDIASRLERISKCFGLQVAIRHGDTPQHVRKLIAQAPPHILVTTPETFNYIVINDETRKHLVNLEYIVLDEFRDLLESKRGLLLLTNIYFLEKYLGKKLTKIALTATLSSKAEEYAKRLLDPYNNNIIVLRDASTRSMDVKVVVPVCSSEFCEALNKDVTDLQLAARLETLFKAIESEKHVLVFTNTRSLAERLGALMKSLSEKHGLDISLEVHHGSLSKAHREKVELNFKHRKLNALIATSSLELGIDIGHVNYVVQYMSPRQVVRLVQRIGRSRHRIEEVSRGAIVSTSNLLHLLESSIIALKAKEGFLEHELISNTPLDVLAYAIALFTFINPGGVDVDMLYEELVKYPLYSNLTKEDYSETINYLAYTRVVKLEKNLLYPTRKTRLYLYKVSMIPSSREINVVSVDKAERVGNLDEEYVVLYLNPGDLLVLAGKPWRVVGYDDAEGKLYVEPAKADPEVAIIPHWEGENIPVDYHVAYEVGKAVKYIKENGNPPEHLRKLVDGNIACEQAAELGDSHVVYVDYVRRPGLVLINLYGGSRLNNLIKDFLKYTIKSTYPQVKFHVYATPYTIVVKFEDPVSTEFAKSLIYNKIAKLYEYTSRSFIEKIAVESTTCLWRIYQVAQRFGAITPETKVSRKLIEAYVNTIIGKEALREVLTRDYDIDSFKELADKIKKNIVKVEFRVYDTLNKHHIVQLNYIEIPKLLDVTLFDTSSYYERLLKRRITLLCINCGFHKEGAVKDFMSLSNYSCPKCGLATLTMVKGDLTKEMEVVNKLRSGKKLNPEERRLHEDLAKRAVLLYRHGEKALLAFAGRGVGTQELIRIINRVQQGADLVSEVAECEKKFLMVKKYIADKEEE